MTQVSDTAPRDAGLAEVLRAAVKGRVIEPRDDGYDDARQLWNARFDHRPAMIVRCADVADVIRTVRLARRSGLPLAVRSGGHGIAGTGGAEGAIVADLSAMRDLKVDPVRSEASAEPGVLVGVFTAAAHRHGLAPVMGDNASVGLGGLLTGGGVGWLVRRHGLTVDSLRSVEMVTAAGELVTASDAENPDLFWAVRGGGGNAGVVTRAVLGLHPVGMVYGGLLVLPLTAEVLSGYLALAAEAPDELTTIANAMLAPPAPFIPAGLVGRPVFMVGVCFTGDPVAGRAAVEPLARLADPVFDGLAPLPYPALLQLTAEASARQFAHVRSGFGDGLSMAWAAAVVEALGRAAAHHAMVQIRPLRGAVARVPAAATAFAHRDRRYLVAVMASSHEASGSEIAAGWARDAWAWLAPELSGAYVNFLSEQGQDEIRAAYPAATYARLAAIKRRRDPDNLFRVNHNVPPRPGPGE